MRRFRLLLLTALMIPVVVFAGDDGATTPSPWDGSDVNLGGVLNTGNTDSSSFTGGLELDYTKLQWTNTLNLAGQYGQSDGETNAQMYSLDNKTQYSLNNNSNINNYVYTETDTTVNQFSSYNYTSTLTLGYGRDWIKNDKYTISTSIAPGYNRSSIQNSNDIEDSWAAVATTNLLWNISSTAKITDVTKTSIYSSYWEVTSTATVNNKLNGSLSLLLSYAVTYYSEIPEGTDYEYQTNTTTNISLSYSF